MEQNSERCESGQEMVIIPPPYLASAKWYEEWLACRREGLNEQQAVAKAGMQIPSRDFGRTAILSTSGNKQMLSIQVKGGARSLRQRGAQAGAILSDHSDWRKNHLGAIEAAYGKTPFYPHIVPKIIEVFEKQINSLSELNFAIHNAISSFMFQETTEILLIPEEKTRSIRSRGLEIAKKIRKDISVLDLAMKYGPEGVLALLLMKQ